MFQGSFTEKKRLSRHVNSKSVLSKEQTLIIISVVLFI